MCAGHPVEQLRRLDPPEKPALYPPGHAEYVDYRTALRNIADRTFCQSEKYREQQWRADRKGCHADIIEFERVFVRKLYEVDVPAFCHAAWRSGDEQDQLFVRGFTKAKAGESPHNHGFAVDIIHGTKAWELDKMAWSILGHMGKEIATRKGIEIQWGGDWSFYDPAHWELKHWRTLR